MAALPKIAFGVAVTVAVVMWFAEGVVAVMGAEDFVQRFAPEGTPGWAARLAPVLLGGIAILWMLLAYRKESHEKVKEAEHRADRMQSDLNLVKTDVESLRRHLQESDKDREGLRLDLAKYHT